MYYDTKKKCLVEHFSLFVELVEHINDALCLSWWKEPFIEINYIAFYVGSKLYMFHVTNPTIGLMSLMDRKAWAKSIDSMKNNVPRLLLV
jgi:hypothetical protein